MSQFITIIIIQFIILKLSQLQNRLNLTQSVLYLLIIEFFLHSMHDDFSLFLNLTSIFYNLKSIIITTHFNISNIIQLIYHMTDNQSKQQTKTIPTTANKLNYKQQLQAFKQKFHPSQILKSHYIAQFSKKFNIFYNQAPVDLANLKRDYILDHGERARLIALSIVSIPIWRLSNWNQTSPILKWRNLGLTFVALGIFLSPQIFNPFLYEYRNQINKSENTVDIKAAESS